MITQLHTCVRYSSFMGFNKWSVVPHVIPLSVTTKVPWKPRRIFKKAVAIPRNPYEINRFEHINGSFFCSVMSNFRLIFVLDYLVEKVIEKIDTQFLGD
jgi:hypothetical protein